MDAPPAEASAASSGDASFSTVALLDVGLVRHFLELGDDGIALTPKEDSDLCKKSRASSFAPPHPPVTCARR